MRKIRRARNRGNRDFFFFNLLFREEEGGGGERQRERRAKIPSRVHAQLGAGQGAQSHNPDITPRAEIKSETRNQLSNPGTQQW